MQRLITNLEQDWLFIDKDIPGAEQPGIAANDWKTVCIPHDWAVSRPINRDMPEGSSQGFLDRWGIGWYRRSLSLKEKNADRRYLLEFGGIFENSTIWVNGAKAGKQLYGYTGFTLDITDYLTAGKNLIAVRVDNTLQPVDRWYSGAGIYRQVSLIEVPQVHLNPMDITVSVSLDKTCRNASIKVDAGREDVQLAVKLTNGESSVGSESGTGHTSLEISNPKLWAADTPNLYNLEVSLVEQSRILDSITLPIGIREIRFDKDLGMLVNGKPEKLKGVCLHQDIAGVGNAVTKSLLRQRLRIFKDIGCNAIRTSHNTPSTDLLDLCDEMGFYVIDESFDKWNAGSYGRYYTKEWEKDLTYMVRRDRHRACVVMWSVGNEVHTQGSKDMLEMLKNHVQAVKNLDSRPVTCALSPHYFDEAGENEVIGINSTLPIISKIASCVDILALNYQEQWYEELRKANPDLLIVGTETYLFFRGSRKNYFNFSTENPWMDVERSSYVLGGFLWAGADYLGESMGYPSKGWSAAMIRSSHVRKPISWLFESYWSDKPVVHFTVQDYTLQDDMTREHWSTPRMLDCWNFPMYARSPIPYMIFSNCEEVHLFLNGKQLDIKKPAECESRIITGFLPMDAGTVLVKGLNGGQEVCQHTLQTSQPPAKLAFAEPEQHLNAALTRQVMLNVGAFDKEDIPCLRESGAVRFAAEGDCIIEAVDNGDMLGSEPYSADRVHLYQGEAAVILRTQGKKGCITVTAYADGMLPATAELVLE